MIRLLIRFKLPVSILFIVCQYLWLGSGATVLDLTSIDLSALLCFLFLTGFWLFLLLDMINTRIYNKTFWLMSMLIMPFIAPAVYLFRRKKLQQAEIGAVNRRKILF